MHGQAWSSECKVLGACVSSGLCLILGCFPCAYTCIYLCMCVFASTWTLRSPPGCSEVPSTSLHDSQGLPRPLTYYCCDFHRLHTALGPHSCSQRSQGHCRQEAPPWTQTIPQLGLPVPAEPAWALLQPPAGLGLFTRPACPSLRLKPTVDLGSGLLQILTQVTLCVCS